MDATAEAAIGTGGNAKCERLIGLRRLVDFDPQPLPLQWFARLSARETDSNHRYLVVSIGQIRKQESD